jgi:hypothetical protein
MFIDVLVPFELDFNGRVPAAVVAALLAAACLSMVSLRVFQASRASSTAAIVRTVCAAMSVCCSSSGSSSSLRGSFHP